MELKVGMTFTGNKYCFQGKAEVLSIDESNNAVLVELTKDNSIWKESWNLQHTIWGIEDGSYYLKEFTENSEHEENFNKYKEFYNEYAKFIDSPTLELVRRFDDELFSNTPKKYRHLPIHKVRDSAVNPKINRNEICPCGSGKKYKKCCINKD